MSRKSSTKQRPSSAPKKTAAPTRAVLPVRPHTDPEFITEHQIRAAYAARLAGLPLIPITAWTPRPDGSVRAHFPTGATLTHTPDATGFDALTPCPQGAVHHDRITTGAQLHAAAAAAAHCAQLHGRPRTLTLAQAATTTADTQALTRNDIDTGLANRPASVETETPKEHPAP
ncbi:hypothetical protein [Streptomyces sp. BE133]|uniref:hypothetical protein n=1 Tax=Streptomyces sp. BE133 TaxID=3002523 RepID=UPI002E767482|nr:hypothetical protein [Streptomyces sp. BE133]MEE1812659.1 hypothetical protein [Streptomyces sp. BE133]